VGRLRCAPRYNIRQYAQQPHPDAVGHSTKMGLKCFKKYPPGGKHSGYGTDLPQKKPVAPMQPYLVNQVVLIIFKRTVYNLVI
jgi:hypothetical protein